MPSSKRHRMAWIGYVSLEVLLVVIGITMVGTTLLASRTPSPVWLLLAGGVLSLFGVHIVMFRREIIEMARAERRPFLLTRMTWAARYGSKILVPTATCLLLIGGIMFVTALLAL